MNAQDAINILKEYQKEDSQGKKKYVVLDIKTSNMVKKAIKHLFENNADSYTRNVEIVPTSS